MPQRQQHVVGVVDPLAAAPVVAVVPQTDPLPVQPRELPPEGPVEVGLGVAADGGEARVEGDVLEVVGAGEQAHLREHADAGNER